MALPPSHDVATLLLPPCQVWTFIVSGATFRLAPTQNSPRRDEQEVKVDQVGRQDGEDRPATQLRCVC